MQRAYAVLHEKGTLRDHLDRVSSFGAFGALVDLDRHYELRSALRRPGRRRGR